MHYIRLRFVKLSQKGDAFIESLGSAIKNFGIKGKSPYRKGFLYCHMREGKYLFVRFVKEITEKDPALTSENEESEKDNIKGDFKYLFIFSEGYSAYETSRKTSVEEITEYIDKAANSAKLSKIKFTPIKKFDYTVLRAFYKSAKSISQIKLAKIGRMPPNSRLPPEVKRRLIQEVGDDVDSIDATSRANDKNVIKPEIMEFMTRISQPKKVRGIDEDGDKFSIVDSGRITFGVPENEDEKEKKVVKIGRKVIGSILEKLL